MEFLMPYIKNKQNMQLLIMHEDFCISTKTILFLPANFMLNSPTGKWISFTFFLQFS